ncbi:MAG TPA: OmpA family protein [Terriglobia bacterium]|nr:OmpA family protein [Terriglobia bacterium]
MLKLKMMMAIVSLLFAATPAGAETGAGQVQTRQGAIGQPIYTITINVVDRTTKAINYEHRSGSTTVDFQGSPLLPNARGEAKVESKKGYVEVEVEFDDMQSATRFGPEFLTYVLWAITPEGRATNMGEIIIGNGTKGKLNVTTELQAFGMIVTAEPYFAVSQPSDAVVMENVVRKDTVGKVEEINVKYELLQRGQYVVNALPADLKPIKLDKKTPLDLYEARNAVRIARWAGAAGFATESYNKASALLAQAEAYKAKNADSRSIAMTAREAVQTAEDARLITLKAQAAARLAQERAASAGREAAANAAAANARADANSAERGQAAAAGREAAANAAAANARADANSSERGRAVAAQREAAANTAAANARADANDAERGQIASAQREVAANAAAANARADASEAERLRAVAQAQADRITFDAQLAAQHAADQAAALAERTKMEKEYAARRAATDREAAAAANKLAAQATAERSERDKQDLRNSLELQLNKALDTRDSARGLIVNMSDVLFDSGQYSLKPGAREKLSRISGILMAYPTLKLEVEGHADSVGTDALNMTLSENRAKAVMSYLISQGIGASSISSRGFGESQPVATNDTAAGRQQNRRVELVVSGEAIGGWKSSALDAKPQQ